MQPFPTDIDIFTTADGSPTLAFKRADGYIEKMHHTGGALSESLYIYREALQITLDEKIPPRVLSLGLGLGYNELITLAECERSARPDFKIWSFEALPVLREAFREGVADSPPPSRLGNVVSDVAGMVAEKMGVRPDRLCELARQALTDGRLELRGPYPEDLAGADKINTVYYDAYSNKMDPHLWLEDVLTGRLGPCLDSRCVLATYAATGALNRALKGLGFQLLPKAGFLGKRQSTLAIRGLIR